MLEIYGGTNMIQDIAPHFLDNHFEPGKEPSSDSPVVCFNGKDVLLRYDEKTAQEAALAPEERPINFALAETHTPVGDLHFLPTYGELPEDTNVRFLFTYDGVDVFRAHNVQPMDGFLFDSIRDIRQRVILEKNQVFLLMTALQLNNWYVDNRYCGRCATPTVHSPRERALVCPECHRTIYPRILPAVIVAVTHYNEKEDKHKILLTKYSPKTGHAFPYYALVAGFTEIGETLEGCVRREVMEETGIHIKNIRYYKSQPWAVVDDLLMGFYCEADSEELDEKGDPVIHLDENELRTGVWLTPEEMTLQPDAYSLTNEMMLLFKSENVHSPDDIPIQLDRTDIEALEREFYK